MAIMNKAAFMFTFSANISFISLYFSWISLKGKYRFTFSENIGFISFGMQLLDPMVVVCSVL